MEVPAHEDDIHAQERMKQMHDLIELMTGWLADVKKMDSDTLMSLMKMGAKVQKLLEVKDKVAQTMRSSLGGRASSKPPEIAPVDKGKHENKAQGTGGDDPGDGPDPGRS